MAYLVHTMVYVVAGVGSIQSHRLLNRHVKFLLPC